MDPNNPNPFSASVTFTPPSSGSNLTPTVSKPFRGRPPTAPEETRLKVARTAAQDPSLGKSLSPLARVRGQPSSFTQVSRSQVTSQNTYPRGAPSNRRGSVSFQAITAAHNQHHSNDLQNLSEDEESIFELKDN